MLPPKGITKETQTDDLLPLGLCLAKTIRLDSGEIAPGLTVAEHCKVVGEVARALLSRLPSQIRTELFPTGSELVAAIHDIGKVSPTFQKKIYSAFHQVPNQLETINHHIESNWKGHAGTSQATAKQLKLGYGIPEIVGQHHGYSPNLGGRIASDQVFGGEKWQIQRQDLINQLFEYFACGWPELQNSYQLKVLSGLTTVADWIGSGSIFENNQFDWLSKIDEALDAAGFIPPEYTKGLSFEEVFPPYSPRDAQAKLITACKRPGVYILEAPMGLGKTEAALFAAYQIMSSGNATGLYFALPTQLTSEKIQERVNQFLQRILTSDCKHRQALLLHGNAWLRETEMGEEGQPGGSWYSSGKRGILAPFAVGTIDQALMAVMNVKHGFVRTFGLAGKVVILDEVHTYDAYTGTILDFLVEALRHLKCTVIILSATLTRKRREALLSAKAINTGYPLVSSMPATETLVEIPLEDPNVKEIIVEHCHDDPMALETALEFAETGAQVLWIENTVAKAQAIYRLVAARAESLPIQCGLLHSRFMKVDRDAIENEWVELYGKDDKNRRAENGRILVGTQVLEQSLDIDADLLISRISPTDMLLQRIGRLWRHAGISRPGIAKPRVIILAPTKSDATDNAQKAFGDTALVYSPYVLCRTLEVWEPLKQIILPSQIRPLIESTYDERTEEDNLLFYQNELQRKKDTLERLALVGLSEGGSTLPESKASTRYSELESCEVLLIRGVLPSEDIKGVQVELLCGQVVDLPQNRKCLKRNEWRKKSAILMQNIVRVVDYQAPDALPRKSLVHLKDYLYITTQNDEDILRIGVGKPDGSIVALDGGKANQKYQLSYDSKIGYQATR